MKAIVIQFNEETERQIEAILVSRGWVVSRPNRVDAILEELHECKLLVIDPKGRGFNASRILAKAMRLGIHIVQAIADDDPLTEKRIA